MIELIFNTALFLVIWFETDAFVRYANLLKLTKLFKLDEYNMLNEASSLSYLDYRKEQKAGFLTDLISCPICVSTQIGLFSSILLMGNIFLTGVIVISSLLLYYIFKLLCRKIT